MAGIVIDGNNIYRQDDTGKWLVRPLAGQWVATTYPPTTPPSTLVESMRGMRITAPGQPAIVNALKEQWTMVAGANGNQIAVNGIPDVSTSNVKLILYWPGSVFQQNTAGNWWMKNRSTDAWASASDPSVISPPTPIIPLPMPSGIYRAVNGVLVDPSGAQFRARGICAQYSRMWGAGGGSVDLGRSNSAKLFAFSPKMNFVRFGNWQGALCNPSDPTVVSWVNDLTSHGIIVSFDLHYTGNAISPNDQTANSWFAKAAAQYKNNPMVWYNTQNEPHGSGISAMMLGQYNAIRGAGATAPISLAIGNPGGEMTSMSQSDFAGMTNVTWDLHYYGWVPNSMNLSYKQLLSQLSAFRSKDGVIPDMCLEFGDSTDGANVDTKWQYVLSQVLDPSTGPVGGYSAWIWNWDNSNMGDRLLDSPFDGSAVSAGGGKMIQAAMNGP